MRIRGIAKVRNEAEIIGPTLDNFAAYCTDGIHVYDDCSTDGTADVCRAHPAVVEVIASDLFDPDRERAEWFCRAALLRSAQRFLKFEEDWILYFDADERIERVDLEALADPHIRCVCVPSFDVYITPEDADLPASRMTERAWCGGEYELQAYFFRNSAYLQYFQNDQRNPNIMEPLQPSNIAVSGMALHYGKGDSVERFARKCEYYAEVFGPKYAAKWAGRRGMAVKHDMFSDHGHPLVRIEDLRSGAAEGKRRRREEIVR
jgi:glycosyltransferase involved in cell wall biosynthesis